MEQQLEEEEFVLAEVDNVLLLLKEFNLENLTVIKKNGRRSPFDREKLAKSLFTALKKRPIDSDTTEKIVSKIVRELEEMGQSEIQSSIIGRKVMDELKELDKIAYIRFASVYTNFKEIGEFGEYIDELHGKSKKEINLVKTSGKFSFSV